MTDPWSPTVRRRRLAAELRALREGRGESGEVVAVALSWSPSKISRYELAKGGLKPADVGRLLDYYEVTGARREQLLALARDAAQKGWWEEFSDVASPELLQFVGLENEASMIAIWHVEVVTGLLQTESYARHIIGAYDQVEPIARGVVERRVRLRMARQQMLNREPPINLTVVLDESVLRRRIGNDSVMYEQLRRLALDDRPNVTLRILPLNAEHDLFGASYVIFRFGPENEATLHDVVSTEGLRAHFYVEGEHETYLHRLGYRILLGAALDPETSRSLILETAETLWRGN